MQEHVLLPHLFRTEYRKIISVLCSTFGIEHIEIAEDIVSDTFLSATEQWSLKGSPPNPAAWLYTVAKNKTKNHLKRSTLFEGRISPELQYTADKTEEFELDFSRKNISDSQLAMIFTVCDPVISAESQIALALNLLCGFGIQEIADAFLSNKEVIYKRLSRAKEKLKAANIKIGQPTLAEIDARLETVLTTLYLLFSEGYYSTSQNRVLRKDLCAEAMRLCCMLAENIHTGRPAVKALLALMYFHSSRFEARISEDNQLILYQDQDETLWDKELIEKGTYYLNAAASGSSVSRYHLEGGIAYWHTQKEDTDEKWENILELYNNLLIVQYSPIAALNRTFALARVRGKAVAIVEAEKLRLTGNQFYHSLLGNLYTDFDNATAMHHYRLALGLANSETDKVILIKHIKKLEES